MPIIKNRAAATGILVLACLLTAGDRVIPNRAGRILGVLLSADERAFLTQPGDETLIGAAVPGALLYTGSRLKTAGAPAEFYYYPNHTVYRYSPAPRPLPAPRLDANQTNANYEIAFGSELSRQRGGLKEVRTVELLIAPDSERWMPPAAAIDSAALERVSAALRSRSQLPDEPLLRLTRAALLERGGRLADARDEYGRIRPAWPLAKWIPEQKIDALNSRIVVERRKQELAQRPPTTFAVLIGVADYQLPRIPRLAYADRDAEWFRDYFAAPDGGAVPANQIKLLTNRNATRATIRRTIRETLENAGPRDTVFIAISGQGWTDRSLSSPKPYLMAYDSNPQEKEAAAYPLSELSAAIRSGHAVGRVLVLADICRSPAYQSVPNTVNALARAQLANAPGQFELLLASSAAERPVEVSRASDDRRLGWFTYYVVNGLRGAADQDHDGDITRDELYRYVAGEVSRETAGSQHPERWGTATADFVMGGPTRRAALRRAQIPNFASIGFPGMLFIPQAAAPQAPVPSTDPENEGQRVLLRYLEGAEAPQRQLQPDFDSGATFFRSAFSTSPSPELDARALFCEGRSLIFTGQQYPRAIELLQNSIRLEPEAAYSYNALGIARLSTFDYFQAAWAFRDAINRAPHWIYPRHNLALTYLEGGAYDGAEREYREALRIEPQYATLHYGLGMTLARVGRTAEAEREYRRSIEIDAKRAEAYVGLGALLASRGKWDAADVQYAAAFARDPSLPAIRHNRGLIEAHRKQWDKAISYWKENVALHPEFVASRLSLADAYRQREDLTAAAEQYEAILKLAPNLRAAGMGLHETRGDQQQKAGSAAEAATSYRAAMELAVDRPDRKRLSRKLRHR